VAEAPFELVGVAAGGCGEREGKRVPQVVGPQRADVPVRVAVFRIVPAADLLADRLIVRGESRPSGPKPIGAADRDSAVDVAPASAARSCSR
jgi:hypothetical protein